MTKSNIALVGIDQIGIAIALAIKSAVPDSAVVLVDQNSRRLRDAGKYGKFDRTVSDPVAGCKDAVLVILNLAPSQLAQAFTLIGPVLPVDAVVLDLSGAKETAVRLAAELLPKHVHYMGCHLILHPERAAETEPSAALFHGAVLCMTPTAETDAGVIKIGSDLAKALGARPYFLEVAEHDGMIGGVEGLPGLLSAALALTTMQSEAWPELSVLAGPLYDQASRLLIDPVLDNGAELTSNRAHVLRWLDALQVTLRDLRRLIDEGQTEQLEQLFTEVAEKRMEWLNSKPLTAWRDEDGFPQSDMKYQRPNPLLPHWGVKA
jgi:prephenate dehydrogenase